jgi:hypothetical protein
MVFRSLVTTSQSSLRLQLNLPFIYSFRGISFKENARRCAIVEADISLTYLGIEHKNVWTLPSDCRTALQNGRVTKARVKNTRLSYTKPDKEFPFEYPEAYRVIAKARDNYYSPSVHLEVGGIWNGQKYFINVCNVRGYNSFNSSFSGDFFVTEVAKERFDRLTVERISLHTYDFKNNKEIK